MEEERWKLDTSKQKLNRISKKPAKDRDYETYRVNIRERSNSFNRTCSSTTIGRVTNVRKSLLKIKVNTVSGIVNLFNQSKKSISLNESPINETVSKKSQIVRTESHDESNESNTNSPSEKPNEPPINSYISYYNELSSIKQFSVHSDSKMNSENMELSLSPNESSIRQRSRSCNAATLRKPVDILQTYKKYPNFKFKYFKYFGVDARDYLSSHGVDVANIFDLENMKTGLRSNEKVVRDNKIDHIRRRSKSFSAKTLSTAKKIDGTNPNYPNFNASYLKYFGVAPKTCLLRRSSSISTDLLNIGCVEEGRYEIDNSRAFSSQNSMLKEVAENSTINVDRETKFLHTTDANSQSKIPKMLKLRETLDTVPEETQGKISQLVKANHDKLPLQKGYIAELKARLRQSSISSLNNSFKPIIDDPQLRSATKQKIDQISTLQKSDTQEGKDFTKISVYKSNMSCVKKGLKHCNKILSSKLNVER